uniref:Uncharacterized protein n=1 Tax=Arundo donax TaxID=35708 RepID=A0A0A9DTT2_ARUDO
MKRSFFFSNFSNRVRYVRRRQAMPTSKETRVGSIKDRAFL